MPVVPGTKVKVVFIPLKQAVGTLPFGNPLNFAMVDAAPPCDANYKTQASFLAATEAVAENIIKTISAYNALAAQRNLPAIEALRNTLFSSNIYNQDLNVPKDQIARAIFKGFATALSSDPNSGLVELQFPVGDAKLQQDRLFAVVEQDLALSPSAAPHPFIAIRGGVNVREPLDPNNDDDKVLEEPAKVQEVDAKGADPKRIIVANGYDLTNATTALVNATKALDPILKGSAALPKGPYGRVNLDEPRYAEATSAMATGREYQMIEIRASEVPGVEDTPAQNAARGVSAAALKVLNARDTMVEAQTLDEAKAARDNAELAAGEAETAATKAEAEAAKGTASARDKRAAVAAREVARTSRNLAKEMDASVRVTERSLSVYRDAGGRLALSRILSPVVASIVILAAGIGGLLGWLFGSKGGREVPDGPANKPLDLGALDDGNPVDVDVMAENMALDPAFEPSLVKAVHLSDMGQITDTIGTPGTTDVWTAANKHITFTPLNKPKSGDKASVLYALEYDGTATSPATLLQITFVDKAIRLVQKAVTDSKGAVSATFALPLPDQFVLRPSTLGWTLDKANKTLTYVPPAGTTAAVVSEDYSLGLGLTTNTAKIVVLLPPADLPLVKASPTSPMIPLQQLPDPAPAVWTLVQSAMPVAGGVWSLANNTIMFVPDTTNPPAVGSTLTVDFELTLDNVVSETGKASIQFTGTVTPMSMNFDVVAPNRTNPSFSVSIPAAVTGLQLGSAATAEGSWNVSGNQVVFTPKSATSFVDQASNTYVAAGVTGTITIVFPIDIVVSDADRQAATPINILAYNPKITRSFTLSVQDTVPPLDSSAAAWKDGASSMPKAPGMLQFIPPSDTISMTKTAGVLQIASVSKVYVMTFADGSSTSAKVTLNFTTGLKAYDFTYDALASETYITIDFLPHCYVPSMPGLRSGQIAGGSSPAYAEPDRQNSNIVVGNWNLTGMGTRSLIILSIVDRSYREFHVTYAVVDLSNAVSNSATITVRKPAMAMPKAADFMLAKDIWSASNTGNEQLAVDVLKASSSFYTKDPASVTLTGLYDLGQDFSAASSAILQTDGKGLRIPDEGVWVVDDKTGNIGFQSVPGLTHAPTPVGFRFCDVKGNQSNEGIVVVDPLLTHAVELPKALAKMDDTAFWIYFRKHISQWQPPLGADVFIATITVLAGATKSIGRVGRNPVSGDDFDKGFNAWVQGGNHWDDPAGTVQPVGLFSICCELVKGANQGTDMIYRERYWALTIMARMAAKH